MHVIDRTKGAVASGLMACALSIVVQPLHSATGDAGLSSELDARSMTDRKVEAGDARSITDRKVEAEIEKLRAEAESLRALRPFSREATAWLAAAGTIAGGLLGAFITFVVDRMGQNRLLQERELAREQHNLQLFQHLGNGRMNLRQALRRGDKALVGNAGYRRFLKPPRVGESRRR
jgi:hypothetical protein